LLTATITTTGTEAPTLELLNRRPYGRRARLITNPMARNILTMSALQLCLLLGLLFAPHVFFKEVRPNSPCLDYRPKGNVAAIATPTWDSATGELLKDNSGDITCNTFFNGPAVGKYTKCQGLGEKAEAECFDEHYEELKSYEDTCMENCINYDYVHYSIIFNAFVFSQLFNEFNARSIGSDWNCWRGLNKNPMFMAIIFITLGLQIFVIEVGGEFTKTAGLTPKQWLISSALGFITVPVGILMRFIPVKEDPKSFAGYDPPGAKLGASTDNV
jgi:magnesium-transporting ATPase (P-type)